MCPSYLMSCLELVPIHVKSSTATVQEFLSKWQANLAKHEGQLASMQQTLLQYLHAHDAISKGEELTAFQRLLSSAREHVLAPLHHPVVHSHESSSEDDTLIVKTTNRTLAQPNEALSRAQVRKATSSCIAVPEHC